MDRDQKVSRHREINLFGFQNFGTGQIPGSNNEVGSTHHH